MASLFVFRSGDSDDGPGLSGWLMDIFAISDPLLWPIGVSSVCRGRASFVSSVSRIGPWRKLQH